MVQLTKSDLRIIEIPGKDKPILANLDLGNSYRYYKYPTALLGVGKFRVVEYKSANTTEEVFVRHYCINYVMPTLKHDLKKGNGWLSPNGEFYPCAYDEVALLAIAISNIRFGTHGNMALLINSNWAYVKYNGDIIGNKLNAQQLATIRDLILLTEKTKFSLELWKKYMKNTAP